MRGQFGCVWQFEVFEYLEFWVWHEEKMMGIPTFRNQFLDKAENFMKIGFFRLFLASGS